MTRRGAECCCNLGLMLSTLARTWLNSCLLRTSQTAPTTETSLTDLHQHTTTHFHRSSHHYACLPFHFLKSQNHSLFHNKLQVPRPWPCVYLENCPPSSWMGEVCFGENDYSGQVNNIGAKRLVHILSYITTHYVHIWIGFYERQVIHMHTYICTCTHAHMRAHTHARTHAHTHTPIHTHIHIYEDIF